MIYAWFFVAFNECPNTHLFEKKVFRVQPALVFMLYWNLFTFKKYSTFVLPKLTPRGNNGTMCTIIYLIVIVNL